MTRLGYYSNAKGKTLHEYEEMARERLGAEELDLSRIAERVERNRFEIARRAAVEQRKMDAERKSVFSAEEPNQTKKLNPRYIRFTDLAGRQSAYPFDFVRERTVSLPMHAYSMNGSIISQEP